MSVRERVSTCVFTWMFVCVCAFVFVKKLQRAGAKTRHHVSRHPQISVRVCARKRVSMCMCMCMCICVYVRVYLC